MSQRNDHTIIGIDGGGTHTRGILFRDGKIQAKVKSGTTRIGAVGVGESCERTLNVITELCNQADIETSELDAVIVGLAGVWLDEEKKRSAQLLKTLARGQYVTLNDLVVTSDAEIALHGAFDGNEGIITIVGTGSIGLAKYKDKLYRCGGWGIELDDEGSGAWIGREGLTAVVRALDGRGKHTAMVDVIEDLYPTITLEEPRTIVKAYAEGAFEYQMLTPSVMKCAEEGDDVSLEIIKRSAKHLAELPQALLENYPKNKKVDVALMGGIIDAKTLLAKLLIEEITKNKRLNIVEAKGSALDGAIDMGHNLIEEMQED
jgi:N-acetylglucosamine kinase-like BadF-type ATPase